MTDASNTGRSIKKFLGALKKIAVSTEGKLFFLTLALHSVVVVLVNSGFVHFQYSAGDEYTYHAYGTAIAGMIRAGTYTLGAVYPYNWYPLFVGAMYSVFGSSMMLGAFANAILIACSAVLFFRILRDMGVPKPHSFWTSLIVMNGYASLMYQSSLLLKDPWILALLLALVYLGGRLIRRQRFSWGMFAVFVVLFLALRNLRFFIGIVAAVGFFVGWFVNGALPLRKKILYGLFMLCIITGASLYFTGNSIGDGPSLASYADPGAIDNLRTGYFKGGATTTDIQIMVCNQEHQCHLSVSGLALSFFTAFLGPFPRQLSLNRYLFVLIDLLWWYPILFFSIIGVCSIRLKDSLWYLVIAGGIFVCVAVGTANLGALLRYRIPPFVLFSLFAPFGYRALRKRMLRRRTASEVSV